MYGQQDPLHSFLSTLWGQPRDARGLSPNAGGNAPAPPDTQPAFLQEREDDSAKGAASQVPASIQSSPIQATPSQSSAPLDTGRTKISGASGDDTLWGGDGRDSIAGQGGDDTIHGGAGGDTIRGGTGHDNIYGDGGDDLLYGGAGQEDFWGGEGDDTIYGNEDQDIALGGGGDDRIWAGQGDDIFSGEDGNDVLYGESGADSIWGGENQDTIFAGGGDDRIEGDGGGDTLHGGGGRDQFITDSLDGDDIVADFNAGQDQLVFRGVYAGVEDALAHAWQQGSAVVFDTGGGNGVTVLKTDLAELTGANLAIW